MVVNDEGTELLMEPSEVMELADELTSDPAAAVLFLCDRVKVKPRYAWGRSTPLLSAQEAAKVAAERKRLNAEHAVQHRAWLDHREELNQRRHEAKVAEAMQARDERKKAEEANNMRLVLQLAERDAKAAAAVQTERLDKDGPDFNTFVRSAH